MRSPHPLKKHNANRKSAHRVSSKRLPSRAVIQLTMRTFLMLFALVLAWNVFAQSPDQQLSKTNGTKQAAKIEKRGTEQSPIVVKVIPPLADDETSAAEKKDREEKLKSDRWLVKLTGILALIGFLQLIVFGLQARRLRQTIAEMKIATKATEKAADAADRTVKAMEDTAIRQLRAYVSVYTAQIVGIKNGDTPVAHLVIKNSGQTPAYDLRGMGGIAMGISFETLPPPTGPHGMTKASLSAGAVTDQFHSAPQPLGPEAIGALLDGRMTLWVYGEMHYRDTFNIARFTKYRFQIGGAAGVRDNKLAICEEGNDET